MSEYRMQYDRLMVMNPERAIQFKLLSLLDVYSVSKDPAEMLALAEVIDCTMNILGLASKHYRKMGGEDYRPLDCEEITAAGYGVQAKEDRTTNPWRIKYRIYRLDNDANVITSKEL